MSILSPVPATRVKGHPRSCTCPGCRRARNHYRIQRQMAVAHGTWDAPSNAEPWLQVIAEHAEAGWTPRQMAFVTGLTYQYMRTLLGITPEPQPRTIRPTTARAIEQLIGADRLDPRVPDETFISPVGSIRRIQALRALGWPMQMLEARYGTFLQPPPDARCSAGYARTIRDVYEELSGTTGPSTRVASLALRQGWAPPLAWEGVDIDDPRAFPDFTGRCGTPQGYQAHRGSGIPACQPCKDAEAKASAERKAKRAAAARLELTA